MLGRAQRRVVVVDAGAPRNAPAAHMQGFLSRDGMPPADLLRAARAEVRGYGVEIIDDRVSRRRPASRSASPAAARSRRGGCSLATGAVDELPDIPGAARALGPRLPPLPLLPRLGGSRPADRRARDRPRLRRARPPAPPMVGRRRLLHAHAAVTAERAGGAEARGIARRRRTRRAALVVDDRLDAVSSPTVAPSHARRLHPAGSSPARRRPRRIARLRGRRRRASSASTPTGRTSVPGVWVAGNAANPRAQVITAAGEGSAAAIAINADLVEEDVRTAVHTSLPRPSFVGRHPTERTSHDRFHRDPPDRIPPPSKHQLALMIWLCVFPTLTAINLAFGEQLRTCRRSSGHSSSPRSQCRS